MEPWPLVAAGAADPRRRDAALTALASPELRTALSPYTLAQSYALVSASARALAEVP